MNNLVELTMAGGMSHSATSKSDTVVTFNDRAPQSHTIMAYTGPANKLGK